MTTIDKIRVRYNRMGFKVGQHFDKAKKLKYMKVDALPSKTSMYVIYAYDFDKFGKKYYVIRIVQAYHNDGSFTVRHTLTKDYYQKWRADRLYEKYK